MSRSTPLSMPHASARGDSGARILIAVALVAATVVAYGPSFSGVFVFDDEPGILLNRTIRHFGSSLFPPADSALSGRPVANVSLAFNYALSGTRIWSYHALNLLIHLLAGVTLFGICRRTMARFRRTAPDATLFAGAVALLWTLHPLQTEAVTYVVQRVESLMAWFYLLTIYGLVRSFDSAHPRRWRVLAVAACVLGVGTKEVIATAPLMVLLYDRTFGAGSFRAAWRERRGFYLALAATWLPLAALVASTGWDRGGTAGFDVGIAPGAYWLTQFPAIARYVCTSAWPYPLVFDFPTFWVHRAAEIVPHAAVVLALIGGTLWALWRWPVAGFLGAWFFVILAPTSVIPGTIQMIADHRMYLPLAAVLAAGVAALQICLGRRSRFALLAIAVAFGCLTAQRNTVYRSAERLWGDTLAKRPDSERAHVNLGNLLAKEGRFDDAIAHFLAAIRLGPTDLDAHVGLGSALRQTGHPDEAVAEYEQALRRNPRMVDVETALGETWEDLGRHDLALAHFRQAAHLAPTYASPHEQMAIALAKAGRSDESLAEFKTAIRLDPSDARVHVNFGNALRSASRPTEALAQFEEALRLDPRSVEGHHALANTLAQADRLPEAIAQYQQALAIDSTRADIRDDYGLVLLMADRTADAITQFERALQTNPNFGDAQLHLAMVLQSMGRSAEASEHYAAARRLGVMTPPPSVAPANR